MASLKDLIVTGATRLIGDAYVNNIQITAISAPTASNGTTYNTGSSGQVLKSNGTSIYWANDNNTNTDTLVTQTATTTNAAYEVLFSATADNTTRTETARKNVNLTFNPSTGNLAVTQINGVTVGSSPKFTDTNTWRGIQDNLTSSSNTTESLSAKQGYLLANGSARDNTKLPLAGGTMSGRITMSGKPINQILIGEGTAAKDAGSGDHRYQPAEWKFNAGTTATDGDIYTIKIPVAGHDYGVFMSVDNKAHYYPVVVSGTSRITTHYPVNTYLQVVFEAAGSAASMYPHGGGTDRVTVNGGVFRVINYYDSGNSYCCIRNENGRFFAGATGLNPYSLACLDSANKFSMLLANSTNAGTGTNKTINTSGKYKLPAVILYYSANNTTAANTLVPSTYNTYVAHFAVDTRYSHNHTATFNKNSPLYIECTIDSNGYWSPTTKCITQTLTSGNYYIYLGLTYSTEHQLSLAPEHPCYYYDGTNLTDYTNHLYEKTGIGLASDTGTSSITLAHGGKYKLSAGDSNIIFTIPNAQVEQTAVTASNYTKWRPLLLGYDYGETATYTTQSATNKTYTIKKMFSVQPSTGTIYATRFQGTADTASKVVGTLTFGSQTYNGSQDVAIEGKDLGLTSPMRFKGISIINLSDGATTKPVPLKGGTSLTPEEGDVVLDATDNEEYIWSGNKWNAMGIATSYAMAQHIHGNITNNGSLSSDVNITNGSKLVITDANNSNKISRASISFDGSTTTTALSQKGTWESFLPISGGTLEGNVTLNKVTGSSANYGDTLPSTGSEGQLFFKVGGVESKIDTFYPVGSIYMSVNSANPGTLFGGTWERIQDCFLLAAGSSYSAGTTGGAAEHMLTIAEMPAHNHGMGLNGTGSEYAHTVDWATSSTGSGTTGMSGEGQAFSIMPPYLAVYVWKRVS